MMRNHPTNNRVDDSEKDCHSRIFILEIREGTTVVNISEPIGTQDFPIELKN